ncbi:fatty acyl-CoA reductase 1-like isoform X1 [Aricia agestis]|uniref:fatty acyl-CoA reductase 1-like isoform X1 n=1 Tax=Aricia agestis TaxID=91739 RepID=UPI001C2058A9|nr:fatty acyl-CoA reductase 1-like isoform X1 [Aricia agestis]
MRGSVADFYDGKSIFICGSSGFIGKVLLEKLLYSCPGIEYVYILIRDKKADFLKRMKTFLDKPIFERLKKENPSALDKIIPIKGDLTLKNLGLTPEDEKLLIDKVSIVIHLAATIRFKEPIDAMFNINVCGTERLLTLCKRMNNIRKFVYVSTAYSNSEHKVIEERIYPAPISINEMKKLIINGLSDSQTEKLLNGKPNTYVLTKSIAEEYVALNHGHVPAIIVRPAIVSSAVAEPLPGWVDNWGGASGLIMSVLEGLNDMLLARSTHVLDLIPVDYVANLIIVAATKDSFDDVPVYHSSTSELNPLNYKLLKYVTTAKRISVNNNNRFTKPQPKLTYTMSRSKMELITLFHKTLPAHVVDLYLHLRGKDKKYTKLLKRGLLLREVLNPFTSNSWVIHAQKCIELEESLSDSDRAIFPVNPSNIDWKEYLNSYINGMYKYLMSRTQVKN